MSQHRRWTQSVLTGQGIVYTMYYGRDDEVVYTKIPFNADDPKEVEVGWAIFDEIIIRDNAEAKKVLAETTDNGSVRARQLWHLLLNEYKAMRLHIKEQRS